MMNMPRVQKSISWPGGIDSSLLSSILVVMSETDGEAAFYSQPCAPQAPKLNLGGGRRRDRALREFSLPGRASGLERSTSRAFPAPFYSIYFIVHITLYTFSHKFHSDIVDLTSFHRTSICTQPTPRPQDPSKQRWPRTICTILPP